MYLTSYKIQIWQSLLHMILNKSYDSEDLFLIFSFFTLYIFIASWVFCFTWLKYIEFNCLSFLNRYSPVPGHELIKDVINLKCVYIYMSTQADSNMRM